MVVSPIPLMVTRPLSSTVATDVLEDVKVGVASPVFSISLVKLFEPYSFAT